MRKLSFPSRGRSTSCPLLSQGFLRLCCWLFFEKSHSSDEQNDLLDQKRQLIAILETLKDFRSDIQTTQEMTLLTALEESLQSMERNVTALTSAIFPPSVLSMQEYVSAVDLFMRLPIRRRIAFCTALALENSIEAAPDLDQVPEIVALIYKQRVALTPQNLQDTTKVANTVLIDSPKQQNSFVNVTVSELPCCKEERTFRTMFDPYFQTIVARRKFEANYNNYSHV
jgi:hypothetical protein